MKIKISDIISAGLDISEQAMPRDIDIIEDFIDLDRPVLVKGRLERVDEFILAKLDVFFALNMSCARCLEAIHKDATIECQIELEYAPRDKYINIGSAVREEILLGYGSHTLCREDCKGICPGCGAYLNKEKCACGKKE